VRSVRFADLAGVARVMPLTCAGIVVGGLSLIGAPVTAGFVTKWYLVLGAIDTGHWWIVFLPVVSSLIAIWYMWRFVEVAYFREPGPALVGVKEAPAVLLLPAYVLVALIVYFGFDTSFTVGTASRAAELLLGGVK
jgi:multicomponent Na+:H+ antiporter subunit D